MKLKQAVVITLTSVLIGCTTVPVKPQKPIEEIVAEYSIKPSEEVGLVYKISKEEGIKQLSSLAMSNKLEDIWYYLPETNEWLDYGNNVSRNGCNPEPKVLLTLRPNAKEVSSYHIHPACNLSMGGFYKSEFKNFPGALPPSKEDLTYLLEEKAELKQSGIKLKELVVVDLGGYWVVNLETLKLDKVKGDLKGYEDIVNKLQHYERLVDSHISRYYSAYKDNKNDSKRFEVLRKDLIKDFEKQAAESGIDVNYYFLE